MSIDPTTLPDSDFESLLNKFKDSTKYEDLTSTPIASIRSVQKMWKKMKRYIHWLVETDIKNMSSINIEKAKKLTVTAVIEQNAINHAEKIETQARKILKPFGGEISSKADLIKKVAITYYRAKFKHSNERFRDLLVVSRVLQQCKLDTFSELNNYSLNKESIALLSKIFDRMVTLFPTEDKYISLETWKAAFDLQVERMVRADALAQLKKK